ncbi:NAD(P)-binding domain-containing protein [soil metagenome]
MAKTISLPKIAVLGAGPIGLEASLHARSLGHAVTVYDQGQVAEHVHRWGHVRLFTPFGMNSTPLGKATLKDEKIELPEDVEIFTGKDWRDCYLLPLAESELLTGCIQTQTSVLTIGRVGWRKTDPVDAKRPLPPFRLLLRTAQGERFDTADIILDCTGTYSRPNWAGDGGIPATGEIASRPQMQYWNDDILGAKKATYAGKSIILIGDGFSAATTINSLATLAEENQSTWVFWLSHSTKGAPYTRVPNDQLKERDRLAARANSLACRCDGNLEFHPLTLVEEIVSHGPDKGFRVAGHCNGVPVNWEVDRVIANVGYRPDLTVCQELRTGEPCGSMTTPEPGYYFLGAKCQGRNSNFLLKDGYEQIAKVFALIHGKAKAA